MNGRSRGKDNSVNRPPLAEAPQPALFTCAQTAPFTTEPSPTALATRLTDPARTSPTAKMPGALVAGGLAAPATGSAATQVRTNPCRSSAAWSCNQPVSGAAPTITNTAAAACGGWSMPATRTVTPDSAAWPCNAASSVP